MHESGTWDERFGQPDAAYGDAPSTFLVEQAERLPPHGRVLVPADGEGRNGLWLAKRGLQVLSVDYSATGLQVIQSRAEQAGFDIETRLADLRTWAWPVEEFDAVVPIYLHLPPEERSAVHAGIVRALKPGGYLILEGFHVDQLGHSSGGPPRRDMLYTEELLRTDFRDLEILDCRREECVLREGRLHQGPAVLLRCLARRPEAPRP